MELLVTLRKRALLEKLLPFVDGVIAGKLFCSSYHLTLKDLEDIRDACRADGKKFYVVMDDFISEDELETLCRYLDFLRRLDVNGIYFHDFGVYTAAKTLGLTDRLIYDGKTVACNSLDTAFLLSKGIDSIMLSRELTLKEIKGILRNNPSAIDLQIFGHIRLSYSKRHFLTNYFKEINKDYDYLNNENMSLIEEKRDYKLPVVESEQGTCIYSDYVLEMFEELPQLKPYLKRGVVDSLFIADETIIDACRDLSRLTEENKEFLKAGLYDHDESFGKAFLYQRTNITKDE